MYATVQELVDALTAEKNVDLLEAQCRNFSRGPYTPVGR